MAVATIKLTFLAFCLNGALDAGQGRDFTVDAAKTHIANGTILSHLETTLGHPIAAFLDMLHGDDRAELLAEWVDMVGTLNERKSALVRNSGICLLLAYVLEGIQRRVSNVAV